MTDLFGVPVSIGDAVVYTTGGQGNVSLDKGTIVDIITNKWHTQTVKIKSESGRTLTNDRSSRCIVSVTPVKAHHPELFI